MEICLEVYFENKPASSGGNEMLELNLLLNTVNNDLGQFALKSSWRLLMHNIEFKLSDSASNDSTLFEFNLLRSSCYLLLNCYMSQRLAIFKAVYPERASSAFLNSVLKYTEQILSSFKGGCGEVAASKPRPDKEDKFLLILNKLLEFYLLLALNVSGQESVESRIGEQLTKLCQLLIYYSEDSLSSQNPLNDAQSIGSDLLSSIGLNILAKKSPLHVKFRFFAKCMAICLLKQILIVSQNDQSTIEEERESPGTGKK